MYERSVVETDMFMFFWLTLCRTLIYCFDMTEWKQQRKHEIVTVFNSLQ